LRDSPPESNKTPFPISAICVFAFGLNSPIKNLGFLSEPCPTPITPPKLNWLSYAVYGATGIIIFSAFADYSAKEGFIAIAIFVVSAIIFGAVMFPPKGPSKFDKFFLKTLFNSMVNRQANYERDNDKARAAAMKMLVEQFKKKYSKKLI